MKKLKCLWCGREFSVATRIQDHYRFCDRCVGFLETVEDLVHEKFGARINIMKMMERRLLDVGKQNFTNIQRKRKSELKEQLEQKLWDFAHEIENLWKKFPSDGLMELGFRIKEMIGDYIEVYLLSEEEIFKGGTNDQNDRSV